MTNRLATIHVGTYKTGSSTLQNYLWDNREEFLTKGVLYPRAGLILDEPEVGIRHSQLVFSHVDQEEWNQHICNLHAEIDESNPSHVVLSCESWSRNTMRIISSLVALVTSLKNMNCEVRTICFYRNIYDYAVSVFREMTRRRKNDLPLNEFISNNFSLFDYDSLSQVYSRYGCKFIPFDSEGLDIERHFDLPAVGKPAQYNTGMSAIEIEIIRIFNVLGIEHHVKGIPTNQYVDVSSKLITMYSEYNEYLIPFIEKRLRCFDPNSFGKTTGFDLDTVNNVFASRNLSQDTSNLSNTLFHEVSFLVKAD